MILRKITDEYFIVTDSYDNVEVLVDGLSYNDNGKLLPIVATTNKTSVAPNLTILDLADVKILVGEVDLDKMSEELYPYASPSNMILDTLTHMRRNYFIEGYNKAIELNKDRKYTLTDMAKCLHAFVSDSLNMDKEDFKPTFIDDLIKTIEPKTSWEVEMVDGKLKLK
jgi:hypothetical protein